MQAAVIEYGRNVLGWSDANTTEVNPGTTTPVIALMDEQMHITDKGGTMRLGAPKCRLEKGSKVHEAYGESDITERHRHRYEFNNEYLEELTAAGLKASGVNPESGLVEVIEIEDHPFFVGVQYHPEYKSTVLNPHPLFVSFVKAADQFRQKKA
jgi:CTP synthase